jgi:hypothetical protein
MKKFLTRTALIAAAILSVLIGFELLFRQVPNQYRLKFDFLRSAEAASSQSCYGIRPGVFERPAFNLANLSQSVMLDHAIYREFSDRLPGLKTVFLELSYFSLGMDTYAGDAGRKAIYDHYLYGNPFRLLCAYPSFWQSLQHCQEYFIRRQDDVSGSRGQKISHVVIDSSAIPEDARSSAARHLMSYRDNRQVYLDYIDELLAKDIRVVLHSPPSTAAYNRLKDRNQQDRLQQFIGYIASKYPETAVRYHDFSTDADFQRMHFMDSNHLNAEGAVLYTLKLKALSF